MNVQKQSIVVPDPCATLKRYTDARIGLGRCGVSLPINEYLQFKLAHARARDAVQQHVQFDKLIDVFESAQHSVTHLSSKIVDRSEYLTRPDKGRLLNSASSALLAKERKGFDICIIICDGLSALAVNESAAELALQLLALFKKTDLSLSPVCFVKNGRVAIGDEIGFGLEASMVITLIGERPGLSAPNSLGVYITHKPIPGTTNESRNCISNIRLGGLSVVDAVRKVSYLVEEGFEMGETGVRLKDKMKSDYLPFARHRRLPTLE